MMVSVIKDGIDESVLHNSSEDSRGQYARRHPSPVGMDGEGKKNVVLNRHVRAPIGPIVADDRLRILRRDAYAVRNFFGRHSLRKHSNDRCCTGSVAECRNRIRHYRFALCALSTRYIA